MRVRCSAPTLRMFELRSRRDRARQPQSAANPAYYAKTCDTLESRDGGSIGASSDSAKAEIYTDLTLASRQVVIDFALKARYQRPRAL
jgi:hypothetical protein